MSVDLLYSLGTTNTNRIRACAKGELMTRRWLLLGVCLTLLAARLHGEAVQPASSPWLSDLAQAEKAAKKTGKPLFVVFRCEH
jgi:hypothetical protein